MADISGNIAAALGNLDFGPSAYEKNKIMQALELRQQGLGAMTMNAPAATAADLANATQYGMLPIGERIQRQQDATQEMAGIKAGQDWNKGLPMLPGISAESKPGKPATGLFSPIDTTSAQTKETMAGEKSLNLESLGKTEEALLAAKYRAEHGGAGGKPTSWSSVANTVLHNLGFFNGNMEASMAGLAHNPKSKQSFQEQLGRDVFHKEPSALSSDEVRQIKDYVDSFQVK